MQPSPHSPVLPKKKSVMRRIATIVSVCFLICSMSISGKSNVVGLGNANFPDRAYLGVYLEGISEEKAVLLGADNPYGSYVTRVIPGSAAEKAGLKPLDYVVGIDHHKVDDDTDLHDLLQVYDAGNEATLHLYRQGKPLDLKITFGKQVDENENSNTRSFLGINPQDEDDEDDTSVGVAVDIVKESSAAQMGLQDGDVITAINGYTMIDWTDISAIIRSLEPESEVNLTIRRNDQTLTKTGKIGKKDSDSNNTRFNIGSMGSGFSWSGRENQTSGAFLGVNLGTMSKEKAKKLGFSNAYGAYVSSVIPKSAAAKGGIQAFDYIYGVDQYRVGEGQSLSFILRKFSAGQKAEVYLIRKGQEKNLNIVLGDRDDDDDDNDWEDECSKPFLGVRQSHDAYNEKGMLVDIVEGSTAKDMGLKDGDIITSINGYPIIDWSDITAALGTLKVGSSASVEYLREGKKASASKAIKSVCESRKSSSTNYNRSEGGNDGSWSFSWGKSGSSGNAAQSSVRVNPANVKAKMEDMDKADADKLKAQGINMPAINNLKVEKINLYPNPTKGLFRLQFDLPEKGITEIKAVNAAGRTIYEYELGNFSGEFSDDVDISQNGVGTYFLQIRQGDKYVSKKVILQ